MKESTAKEKILKSLRNGLLDTAVPRNDNTGSDELFFSSEDELDIAFAKEFVKNGGHFIYCENFNSFTDELKTILSSFDLKNKYIVCNQKDAHKILINEDIDFDDSMKSNKPIDIGICNCDYLISRTGSLVFSSGLSETINIVSTSETILIIARPSQMIPNIKISISKLKDKYKRMPSMIKYLSAPSCHYYFENKPSFGFGVKNLYLILIDDY